MNLLEREEVDDVKVLTGVARSTGGRRIAIGRSKLLYCCGRIEEKWLSGGRTHSPSLNIFVFSSLYYYYGALHSTDDVFFAGAKSFTFDKILRCEIQILFCCSGN